MNDVFFILNLGNIKIEIYHHFSLILCYFWRQNCLKTSILAFWTTLVNACWPHVCDMIKYILGACKYLSEVPFPQISCPEMQNSSWGGWKNHIFPLQAVDGTTTFIYWNLFLDFITICLLLYTTTSFPIVELLLVFLVLMGTQELSPLLNAPWNQVKSR